MRPRAILAVLPPVLVAACAATPIPPAETDYFRAQLAAAQSAGDAAPGEEGRVLRESASRLAAAAATEREDVVRGADTDGLVDLESPEAREFVARASDPARAEAALGSEPLDVGRVLLAVHARNPDVAAARREWAAAVRMYEQATYLEDLLLRYSAFTRLATPRVGAAPMRGAAFPYPGLVALRGEMIDREVAMSREMARMRLRDALVAAAKAYHAIVEAEEDAALREEEVALADRAVAATRARVSTGAAPQAELLEMEAELAMARNAREQTRTSLRRGRAELNSLLDRAPDAPIAVMRHSDPPAATPDRGTLLDLARRFAPEIRIARAEVARTAAAIRMAEAMLLAAPAPGAVAGGAPMDGAVPMEPAGSGAGAPMGGDGGAMGVAPGAAAESRPLPPRGAAPAGAPAALGPDLAWIAELRERHAGLVRAEAEAVRAVERRVAEAHAEVDAMRRMFEVAATSAEPLAVQAVEERTKLYESGRGMFDDLLAAFRRRLGAAADVVRARHAYRDAETMLWMAVGVRPEVLRRAQETER